MAATSFNGTYDFTSPTKKTSTLPLWGADDSGLTNQVFDYYTGDSSIKSGISGLDWLSSPFSSFSEHWNNPSNFFSKQNMFGSRDPITGKVTGSFLESTGAALSGLANLYTGLQSADLAKKTYNTQRDLANINIANQTTLGNDQLYKQYRGQALMEGKSVDDANNYAKQRVADEGLKLRSV